ncbi:MAG: hypothetical protein V1738_03805 [Patescibacteria group bacterium]
MEQRGGPSDQDKMKWAAKETARRLDEYNQAKKLGQEAPDFEPINAANITAEEINNMKDQEWEESKQREQAEEAKLEAEHQKYLADLEADMAVNSIVAQTELIAHETEEAEKRAEILAEEQRQMAEAREAMEREQRAFGTDTIVENEKAAKSKHELLGGETMSDLEMAIREADADELLKKDSEAAKKFNTLPKKRTEAGVATVIYDGPEKTVGQESSVIVEDNELARAAKEKLAQITVEMNGKREMQKSLKEKKAAPDDASYVFKMEMLHKEIPQLQMTERALRQEAGLNTDDTTSSREAISQAMAEAGIDKQAINEAIEFSTEERAFFEQGDKISATNERLRANLQAELELANRQWDEIQGKINQPIAKRGLFGGLWSGLKNALGRGDKHKLDLLTERISRINERLDLTEVQDSSTVSAKQHDSMMKRKMNKRGDIIIDKMRRVK